MRIFGKNRAFLIRKIEASYEFIAKFRESHPTARPFWRTGSDEILPDWKSCSFICAQLTENDFHATEFDETLLDLKNRANSIAFHQPCVPAWSTRKS